MKWFVSVLIALIAIGIYLVTRPHSKVKNSGQTSGSAAIETEKPSLVKAPGAKKSSIVSSTTTNVSVEEIQKQINQLADAETKSDSDSFQVITNALNDERPEVRQAALEAIIQFGSRDAIPLLKKLAGKTEDAREKIKILE